MSSLQWFFVFLFTVGLVSLHFYISSVEKTANKAMWLAVDAMANCRAEFNEYADACEELNAYRKKYGVDGVPEMLDALYNRRSDAEKQLRHLIVD